ncbi:MAG: pyrimidine 5'-nucleotidase [Elusimicrobia bacterium RIFOXYB2_FULL_49_7]|nr:MAG: pyrimidine 5'-nucleotidase [Elusimicrobia bacterium RIFOXYB2_FULL_49_7]
MNLRALWFDLDETLYPRSSGYMNALDARINLYLTRKYDIPQTEASAFRFRLFTTYGATLMGLYKEYSVDYDDYMAFVYDVNPAPYFPANPVLKSVLQSLPQEKIVFTNSGYDYSVRILRHLDILDCFKSIHFLDRDMISKPMPEAYEKVRRATGYDFSESLFIDDTERNLKGARDLGLAVLKIDETGMDDDYPVIRKAEELGSYLRNISL